MSEWFKIIELWLVPIICLVIGYIGGKYRRRIAENAGESQVRRALAKYCENRESHVLSNVTLSGMA